MNKKQQVKKVFKYIAWKALGAFVFITVTGTGIWALAAFTEPTDTPSNSAQDWAKNIMGANNSDNAFDSAAVIANSNGSMIERLENLENKQNVTALSAEGSGKTWADAAKYCFDLLATAEVANTGSNTSTTYTDWRLGTMGELSIFAGTITDHSNVWTATAKDSVASSWKIMNLASGYWTYTSYVNGVAVRCIR